MISPNGSFEVFTTIGLILIFAFDIIGNIVKLIG